MLLAVVGVVAMVAVIGMVSMDDGHSADAAVGDIFSYEGIEYRIIAVGEVEVAYMSSSISDGVLVIPSSMYYNSTKYIVTSIGDWAFSEKSSIESVSIPKGVTSIGDYAFNGCSNITSITLPENLTTIGSEAFAGCSSLTSLTIPDGVTFIGNGAFLGSGLISITLPENLTTIGSDTFGSCSDLSSVIIPEGVITIGDYAFLYCYSLASLTIPESVTSIGGGAFSNCSSLTSITFKSSTAPTLGDGVFDTGTTIKVFTPGWNPKSAFAGSIVSYTYISWANPPQTGDIMFSYDGIEYTFYADGTELYISGYEGTPTEVMIPDTIPYGEGTYKVTSMEVYVFTGCTTLTSMTLPDGIESIGTEAFSGCTNLSSITLPDGIASIGDRAFSGCSALTSMDLPENVTMIGQTAFAGTGLTSVTIPSKVTEIGGGAFFACTGLNTVIFETESVPTLGNTVFETTTTINVYTPGWDPVAELADAHSSATTVVWANPPYPDLIFVSDPSDGTLTFGHFVTVYNDGEYYGTYWVEHGTAAHIVFENGSSSIACSCKQEFHTSNSEQSPMYDGLDELIEDVTVYHFGGWTHSHGHGDFDAGGGIIDPDL